MQVTNGFSAPRSRLPPRWRADLGWAVVAVAPAIQLGYMYRYAVNVLAYDEWALVPFLMAVRDGGDWVSWIFAQHNEHRVAGLRLPLVPIAQLTDWNVVPQMYLGFLLQLCTLFGLWRAFASRIDRDPWRFAPVSFLCFALIGYQIFLYGMMFVWSMMIAAIVWALWLLSRQDWSGLAAAVALAALGSFTNNNGLLVWPLGVLLLVFGKARPARVACWLAAGVAVILFYYWEYHHPGHHPELTGAFRHPVPLLTFFFGNLGAWLGAGSQWGSVCFGAALLVLSAMAWGPRLKLWRQWPRGERVVFCLLLFALASSAAVSLSRLLLGPAFAFEPRYSCFTILVGVALCYQLFGVGASATRPLMHGFVALLLVGHTSTSLVARRQLRDWSVARTRSIELLRQIVHLSDAQLHEIFHDPATLRELVAYMQPRRLGPFADDVAAAPSPETAPTLGGATPLPDQSVTPPVRAAPSLRLQGWQEGVPGREIAPGREVVQRFVCPVNTLANLGLPFATWGRPQNGEVNLLLSEGEREIARTSVPAASIARNGWVNLAPSQPVERCVGRVLTLTVGASVPDSGVTVWTYPAYFGGELYQEGRGLEGRVVGLEINREPS